MKARERKRAKMVAKYAEKRAALKAAGDYEGLQKLPKNSCPVRLHNRCKLSGRPKGYMRQFGISPSRTCIPHPQALEPRYDHCGQQNC